MPPVFSATVSMRFYLHILFKDFIIVTVLYNQHSFTFVYTFSCCSGLHPFLHFSTSVWDHFYFAWITLVFWCGSVGDEFLFCLSENPSFNIIYKDYFCSAQNTRLVLISFHHLKVSFYYLFTNNCFLLKFSYHFYWFFFHGNGLFSFSWF